jgi:hypothetical protein
MRRRRSAGLPTAVWTHPDQRAGSQTIHFARFFCWLPLWRPQTHRK